MTYVLRTTHGEFEQTRMIATAADTASELDEPNSSRAVVLSVDRMGKLITEADLRYDAQHETSHRPLHLPDVNTLWAPHGTGIMAQLPQDLRLPKYHLCTAKVAEVCREGGVGGGAWAGMGRGGERDARVRSPCSPLGCNAAFPRDVVLLDPRPSADTRWFECV